MSKISSIHDAIYSLLATIYPTKNQLADGLVMENNADLDIANGYGVSLGDGRNTERLTSCQFSVSRNVDIILTKEIYASHQDKAAFLAAEKALFEDQYSLLNEIEKNDTIDSLVINRKYISDTGLQRLIDSDAHKQFLSITTTFEFEYIENFI